MKKNLREHRFNTEEGISVQESKFADFYTENPIVKDAAIRAGLPEHLAGSWGSLTLKKMAVKRRIRENLNELRSSTIMQARERREVLSQIARSDVRNLVRLDENGCPIELDFSKGRTRAVAGISIEDSTDCQGGVRKSRSIKLVSPIQAIDTLNKMDKLYDTKVKAGGSLVVIPVEDMEL